MLMLGCEAVAGETSDLPTSSDYQNSNPTSLGRAETKRKPVGKAFVPLSLNYKREENQRGEHARPDTARRIVWN
jgi:hypothetical protein